MDLFENLPPQPGDKTSPLADRMRPRSLKEFVGQKHILGEDCLLRKAIEEGEVGSLILWGPPGSGKTTLAHIIAQSSAFNFVSFSAVTSGIKEIKKVIEGARRQKGLSPKKTLIFVDEIHRFNKAQQDAFLPHIEQGIITFIGATTENPSFEVVSPLLSRSQVVVLNTLSEEELLSILHTALADTEQGLGLASAVFAPEALSHIARSSQGDARRALNILEMLVQTTTPDEKGKRRVSLALAEEALRKQALPYDKNGEEHYNLISALHKSMRGSDPDSTLYWLARMLEAGEDPLYLARRMVRFASEDVGNADPQALQMALAAKEAFHFLGLPEGKLALAQAAVYLATAPKSNAIYTAYASAETDVRQEGALPVPLHIRNAPTGLMKKLGYGKGYRYAHSYPGGYTHQEYLPDKLKGKIYYHPTDRGFEKGIRDRLLKWKKLKEKKPKE
jgi:putative ATPase